MASNIEIINPRAISQDAAARIMEIGTIDTYRYRFTARQYPDRAEIQRIPIKHLDTTAALDGLEITRF